MVVKFGIFFILYPIANLIFFHGVYKNVFRKLCYIWGEYGDIVKKIEFKFMLTSFWQEVIKQRLIYRQSKVRWSRHILISWSFVILFFIVVLFIIFTRILPQKFLISGISRKIFDFSFDLLGFLILMGTSVALLRMYYIRKSEDIIYHDPVAVVLLFVTVGSGFILEAFPLAFASEFYQYSFFGSLIAKIIDPILNSYRYFDMFWYAHVGIACVLLAYISHSRLIHIIVNPLGRLLTAQQEVQNQKIRSVAGGLMYSISPQVLEEKNKQIQIFSKTKIWALSIYGVSQGFILLIMNAYFTVASIYFKLSVFSVVLTSFILVGYIIKDKEIPDEFKLNSTIKTENSNGKNLKKSF